MIERRVRLGQIRDMTRDMTPPYRWFQFSAVGAT